MLLICILSMIWMQIMKKERNDNCYFTYYLYWASIYKEHQVSIFIFNRINLAKSKELAYAAKVIFK